jgi:DMSO/TMAO reductase YedYZ molybdopterin-dependent catalytic subunit
MLVVWPGSRQRAIWPPEFHVPHLSELVHRRDAPHGERRRGDLASGLTQALPTRRTVLAACALLPATLLAACAGKPDGSPPADIQGPAETVDRPLAGCALRPIVAPTAAPDPGYLGVDPITGIHQTGQAQKIDLASYRLRVTGKVEQPLSLSYDELRCLPRVEASPDLECPGFFLDHGTWAGVTLAHVLALARPHQGASTVEFRCGDAYVTAIPLAEAQAGDDYLAYEWHGQPLPVLDGFPVRAVLPKMTGSYWGKWLLEVQVS